MAINELNQYGQVLHQLKEKIRTAQQKAILAVNNHLLSIYWEIGNAIDEQEKQAGWGAKVVEKLAIDLKAEFPEMKGLSPRNLRYMRDFSLAYPTFLQQAAAKTKNDQNTELVILQQAAAKLPWGHHQLLLTKLKTTEERGFYIQKAIENGWSRSILEHQIESQLYKSQGALVNNFKETIPALQSELTQQIFKDPYNFDFIMLSEKAKERDLENALISQVTKVLLELGVGFAFMGRQKRFEAGGREFFVDLLFYHTKLRSHIIIELKNGEFEPEYISKMNLYLGLADDQLRGEMDEPSIGLILCKTNNRIIAEYALRDTSKPIGIAEYKIAQRLPANIKGELPSIEEIEEKLDEQFKESAKPMEEKLNSLKARINQLNIGEAIKKSPEMIKVIYYDLFIPLTKTLNESLESEIAPLFNETEHVIYINNSGNSSLADADFEAALMQGKIEQIALVIQFKGFKKAGINTFDKSIEVKIQLHEYKYSISIMPSKAISLKEMLYNQLPQADEIKQIEHSLFEGLLDSINESINNLEL